MGQSAGLVAVEAEGGVEGVGIVARPRGVRILRGGELVRCGACWGLWRGSRQLLCWRRRPSLRTGRVTAGTRGA
jgi:hypothetical protein